MIPRTLLERVFSAASMDRWNDHPHPPVFHRLMDDRETKARLDEWVAERLAPELDGFMPGLSRAFRDYHRSDAETTERRILRAAHYMATGWEFSFILHWSANMYGMEQTRREVEANMAAITLPSARAILDGKSPGLSGFFSLVGQLTFQKRWAQTPRVPQTSVLAHLMFVAVTAWLLSLEAGFCPRRERNNFFGGLFHDLPEVLTRDIISPVKASVEGLDDMIRLYEREAMEERVLPLLPEGWRGELLWYSEEEFSNKTRNPDAIDPVERHDGDIPAALNEDRYDPIDGRLIEVCDKLAAYMEAAVSIRTGIHPPELENARRQLYERFRSATSCGMPLGYLFEYFR